MKSSRKKKPNIKRPKSHRIIAYIIVGVFGLALVAGYMSPGNLSHLFGGKSSSSFEAIEMKPRAFAPLGTVSFLLGDEVNNERAVLATVRVEHAITDEERAEGLMYRDHLPDDGGMIFFFENEGLRSFWMKNTPLSLDIIYVNADKEIVKIHKGTQPYAERSYPSGKKAKYVVEVKGGFSDKHGVKEGDFIQID
ncbi:MAG: DUF192 domain-containing protein [Cyclobacteriaceae bacterium]|nr:DUF192 domain-containing protein [Cyclobacteriaceae bacterium]MCH8516574.1 DUF192 domain-containing protein [Cyclobacteriaceae bacterium]